MKDKILIALSDQFLSRVYLDYFREEGFLVYMAESEDEVVPLVIKESPSIILLDTLFAEKEDFGVLKALKESQSTRKIPIILLGHNQEEKHQKMAVEFEIKDLIVGEYSSPLLLMRRIKTHLGKEKSYSLTVETEADVIKEMAGDIGYHSLRCGRCGGEMKMVLLRDLSKGDDYFKVSFVCPICGI